EKLPFFIHGKPITDRRRQATWDQNTGYCSPFCSRGTLVGAAKTALCINAPRLLLEEDFGKHPAWTADQNGHWQ
ncbi:hypothetical protein, partial [Rhizobium leguminosarum]|uniref:hypothetical protein n=1 Tax=Rhizobium leguminosarum TaxID=384 RepID=UPI001FE21A98